MDEMDHVRIAGTIVDILKVLGCTTTDMAAIADAIHAHLSVQETEDFQPEIMLREAVTSKN